MTAVKASATVRGLGPDGCRVGCEEGRSSVDAWRRRRPTRANDGQKKPLRRARRRESGSHPQRRARGPAQGGSKTTLVEQLLVSGRGAERAGRAGRRSQDGAARPVCPSGPPRRGARAGTPAAVLLSLSLAPVDFAGTKVNLIDTPGYARLHQSDLQAAPAHGPGRRPGAVRPVRRRRRGRRDDAAVEEEECATVGMPVPSS